MNRIFGLLSISLLFACAGCHTDPIQPDPAALGYDYYPLEKGGYRIYNVHQIDYTLSGEADTIDYMLKETVADSFLNLGGDYSFYLKRFKKNSSEEEWKADSVWTIQKNNERVVTTENNVSYIKMVFPVREGKKWDGNRLNTLGNQEYRMAIGGEEAIGEEDLKPILTVLHRDNPDTILVRQKAYEVYAKNKGLIYKEIIDLEYCCEEECIGMEVIEAGRKYKQELLEYGKE